MSHQQTYSQEQAFETLISTPYSYDRTEAQITLWEAAKHGASKIGALTVTVVERSFSGNLYAFTPRCTICGDVEHSPKHAPVGNSKGSHDFAPVAS